MKHDPGNSSDDTVQVINVSTNIFKIVLDRLEDSSQNQFEFAGNFMPVSSNEDCPVVYGVENPLGFASITKFWDLLDDSNFESLFRRPL